MATGVQTTFPGIDNVGVKVELQTTKELLKRPFVKQILHLKNTIFLVGSSLCLIIYVLYMFDILYILENVTTL